MSTNRVYFPNLNSIRFLASVLVIVHHAEMAKYWFGLPNLYNTSFVGGVFGSLGLTAFFVLSGFLITYLLLVEHERTGKIAIKDFYIRRILRIWPVYYLVVIPSLFIFPHISFLDIQGFTEHMTEGFALKSVLYLSFLPNLAYVLYEHVSFASQAWSVGVEEQFYLMWPVVMHLALMRKKVLNALLGVIIIYLAIKAVTFINYINAPDKIINERIWLFWDHFSIDAMAMGGVSAYFLYYNKERALKILFNKYLQIALYIIIAVTTVKGWVLPWFNKEVHALIFAVLILNLAANKKTVLNFEYKALNYLGKITYGLYMYHNLVIIVVLKFIMLHGIMDVSSVTGGILFHLIVFAITIPLSAISYEYFEKWFLKLKSRFAKVKSGDELEANTHSIKGEKAILHTAIPQKA